ncbi:MAG: hypothetical protein CVU05_10390 [Bacteroidetes bacterium HGW-Bacteroidetes-21]|jgi:serine phosphatase RsbU (regulator of sigma subunit)/Flp pilus assembly protein TadD|nr:MAG: hypothetical protein CVU05_10390 [Bacteroidetes bacterium HGW-Bacteroidetes-21]
MQVLKKVILNYLLTACSFGCVSNVTAGNTIDSLQQVFKSAKNDSVRLKAYYLMGEEFFAVDPDSSLYFYQSGLNLCKKLDSKAKKEKNILKYQGHLFRAVGNVNIQKSDYEIALNYIDQALACYAAIKNADGMSQCYKSIGAVRYYQGDAVKSVEAFQSAMKIAEASGNMESYSDCLNNIGMVHYQQDNNDIALENFKKALEIRLKLGIKTKIAESYNNLGIIYSDANQQQLSLDYYFKALEIFKELGEEMPIGRAYNNIGVVYKDIEDFQNAEKYFYLSLENKIKTLDKRGLALVLGNLSDISIRKGNYQKAIQLADSSLAMAKQIGSLQVESNAYGYLYDAYEKKGDYKQSLFYHKLLKKTSDSLNSVAKFETISDLEAKYENEKKQLQIENLTKEKSLQVVELKNKSLQLSRQRSVIIFVAIGLLMVLVFSILLLRQSRARKKANQLLAQQNLEIQQKNEEISSQRDEIETQRDLVYQQKEHIVEIHKKVTDSINYAKRIQEAVLPTRDSSKALLGEHFILYKPKDIVSGDFYWTTRVNQWLVIAVADCTGHGVPGGFMSMLGISFLNEIVRKKEVTQANHVLNHLRDEIINAMKQTGSSGEQKDGMDISLCAIDTKTLECHWAGANNSLYIIKNTAFGHLPLATSLPAGKVGPDTLANRQLIELKGDPMPVAIHSQMKDFTNHIIQLQKGDTLYLYTDGYSDQFGGPSTKSGGKKFMSKRFRELLIDISQQPMAEQKAILEKTIEDWKNGAVGKFEQTDDITVLGLILV